MTVFIAWSGECAKRMAATLARFLPSVLPKATPFFSPEEIAGGDFWNERIRKELNEAEFGVLCVTPENLSSPWLNFEAGALASRLNGGTAPWTLEVSADHLRNGAISGLQACSADHDGTLNLFQSINRALPSGERASDPTVRGGFEQIWPAMKIDLEQARRTLPSHTPPATQQAATFASGAAKPPEELLDDLVGKDWSAVKEVSILCHTGRTFFTNFYAKLTNEARSLPRSTRVLVRAPRIEGLVRSKLIEQTLKQVAELQDHLPPGKSIEVRFYESLPAVRGIICRFPDGSRAACTSLYQWNAQLKSKRAPFALVENPDDKHTAAHALSSWFDYYWGRNEIHTVVLDFDDTLVDTASIQVKAWKATIEDFLKKGAIDPSQLTPGLAEHVADGKVTDAGRDEIMKIFTQRQLAESIIQGLFRGVSRPILEALDRARFAKRRNLMKEAKFFDGVKEGLHALAESYNLAIVSSTDEKLIQKYLGDHGLLDAPEGVPPTSWFNIVLGKSDPAALEERANIEKKATLFLKLSALTGIPLSRMVYVGDARSDFLAARQVGLDFVEARASARARKVDSLLGPPKTDNGLEVSPPEGYIESFAGLATVLEEIERAKLERKWDFIRTRA